MVEYCRGQVEDIMLSFSLGSRSNGVDDARGKVMSGKRGENYAVVHLRVGVKRSR